LKVDLGHEPVVIEADPTRLAQVVSNLVDNAAKYTPEHGQISVAVSSDHEAAVIAVRDSGVGLPADDLKRIFDPFTQLRNLVRRGGAGLAWGWRSCAP
jgi:signal transduction histidine kinase